HKGMTEKLDPETSSEGCEERADLARRLARYRRRVEAEGRKRSLRVIDRAIDDAADKAEPNH
ncbi:MAG TPA: hypothetical protein VM711_09510, partial [Sphingomicrobium sp.]|nr:hypothetical protein [Sphingomicrobium sp.]